MRQNPEAVHDTQQTPKTPVSLCAGCEAVIYFPSLFPSEASPQCLWRTLPLSGWGHLQMETTKFPLKKKKERKNILGLGNCRVSFLSEDWLIISSKEGGFLTQQMEVRRSDH